jgi:hypothetical protein
MVSQQKGLTNGIFMSNLVEKSNKRGLDEQKNEQALKKWQESFHILSKACQETFKGLQVWVSIVCAAT